MPAGPYSDNTIWHANASQMLLSQMDDVTIAFHKVSGDTHILNFLSAATVKVLSDGAETFASAAPKILEEIQMSSGDCPDGLIESTILQLDEVGLIAPQESLK